MTRIFHSPALEPAHELEAEAWAWLLAVLRLPVLWSFEIVRSIIRYLILVRGEASTSTSPCHLSGVFMQLWTLLISTNISLHHLYQVCSYKIYLVSTL